ncbi:3-keto-5-aminohexanoate cleavage protein [Halobacteriales archaeon Cl-PHB]
MGEINDEWLEERREDGMPKAYSYSYGFPEMNDMTTTEHGPTRGVDVLPQWDLPEKVVISCAPVGAFLSKRQNPNHPIQPDEIHEQTRRAAEAGATSVHVHVRDPETGINTIDADRYHEVLDPIVEDYPDLVIDGTTIPFADGDWDHVETILEDDLFDISPVNPLAAYYGDMVMYEPPDELLERTRLLKDHGVKPLMAVSTDADVHTAKRYLVDTDVVEEPYLWGILPGIPGASYMPDPATMAETLTSQVRRIRSLPGEHEIVVSAAGRASSHLATQAILLGCHVRVGMEDTPYQHPDSDDRIEDNGDEVERFATIARQLGREVATPDEYREMLDIA